jgi:plastocyanin
MDENRIVITDMGFSPNEVNVKRGTEVNFVNNTGDPHWIISEVGMFESGEIPPQEMYSFVFDDPGTQNFFLDDDKENMGRVIVE